MTARQPALPASDRPHRRSPTSWLPVRRARGIAAYPVRTERVIGTRAEVANLVNNPAVEILHGPVPAGPGRWRVTARWTDRNTRLRGTRRWHVEGLRRAATAYAWALGVPTFAVALLAAMWRIWGDTITAAAKAAGTAALAVAVLAALVTWWMGHGRNGCPGLHCDGCGR